MSFKQFELENIGPVTVYKRRDTRSIRLSVNHDGKVRVSIPTWLPYKTGISYAHSKMEWLQTQLAKHSKTVHNHEQRIGKTHILYFRTEAGVKPRSRISGNKIIITHDSNANTSDSEIQQIAEKACIRALRQEAEDSLPARLRELAATHGFIYRSASIRNLKSRWGSCDQDGNIKLNLYLMQLPWELIDYVLLHELQHTQIMQHGSRFWQALEAILPNLGDLRRQIRHYKTTILPS